MKKVYVSETNQATIICPKCGFAKNIDTTNFKNTKKQLKAKCKCGELFRFTLEFRKHYRKQVILSGEYIHQSGSGERGEIIVKDLSLGGIRFETMKPHQISTNDVLELRFVLDNPKKSEIIKSAKVVWVEDRVVGTQFSGFNSNNKDLGFYLSN